MTNGLPEWLKNKNTHEPWAEAAEQKIYTFRERLRHWTIEFLSFMFLIALLSVSVALMITLMLELAAAMLRALSSLQVAL